MAQYFLKESDPWPNVVADEEAMIFIQPGWTGGNVTVSLAKSIHIQPYVPHPGYGGGVKTIRDWEDSLGDRPKVTSLTITGGNVCVLHLEGDLTIKGIAGKSTEERATVVFKGVRGTKLVCDDWQYVVGTHDDFDFDVVDFGENLNAVGFKEVILSTNTHGPEAGKALNGTPKRNSKWTTLHEPRPRKSNGARLLAATVGRMTFYDKGGKTTKIGSAKL